MSEKVTILEVKLEKEPLPKQKIKPPFNFNTTQNNVAIPTKELIKNKDCDFRIILGISVLSNCDDVTKEGDNTRYISVDKLNRRALGMCKTIGIDISNYNKKIKTLLRKKSKEFRLVERPGLNNTMVKCYEMNYEPGGFVTIPVDKAERCLLTLGNNPIKLYCNLLWLCQYNGEFKPTHVPQSTLATLMGLSPKSDKIVRASMQTLINNDLIEVTKIKELHTIYDDEGLPISQTREKLLYNIIVENEEDF